MPPLHRVLSPVAVLAAAALAGCQWTAGLTEQQYLAKARDDQDHGKLEAAVIDLKGALQKNAANAETRMLLAQIYLAQNKGKDAEKELQKARELGVGEEALKVPMGQALVQQGLFDRVLKDIEPGAQSSAVNRARIEQVRSDALFGLGRTADACAGYARARGGDETFVPTHWGLARCAMGERAYDRAREVLQQAVKLEPRNADTWVLLGEVERASEHPQQAIAAYDKAVEAEPEHVMARANRALLNLRQQRPDQARKDIDHLLSKAPNHFAGHYLQAWARNAEGDPQRALEAVQQAVKIAPGYRPASVLQGSIQLSLGLLEEAGLSASRVLNDEPGDIAARLLLARVSLRKGEPKAAVNVLRPLEPANLGEVHALLGEAWLRLKDYDKARGHLEQAIAVSGKRAEYLTALARTRLGSGDNARAEAELQEAMRLDPAQAGLMLAGLYLGQGHYDKALATLERTGPVADKSTVENLRGAALIGKNDWRAARKSFEDAAAARPDSVAAASNLSQLDLKEQRPEEARKRFQAVLAKDPRNEAVMLQLAMLERLQGNEQGMVEWLQRAAKANPSAMRPRELLAEYYLLKRQPAKALDQAREAQARNAENPAALDLLGKVQLVSGDVNSSLATYRKYAARQPADALPQYRLAVVHTALHQPQEARKALGRALELKPDYQEAALMLGQLQLQERDYAGATKSAEALQQQHPEAADGYVLAGDVLVAQSRYAPAAAAYRTGLQKSSTPEVAVRLHRALLAADRAQEADAGLLQWLQQHPREAGARDYLAQTYLRRGQTKAAIEQYELVIKIVPRHAIALNNLALLYEAEKDPRALKTAEQAWRAAPQQPALLDTYGWILLQHGDTARAVQMLKQAAERRPNDPSVGYHLAAALAKAGDTGAARNKVREVLASSKNFPLRAEAEALLRQL